MKEKNEDIIRKFESDLASRNFSRQSIRTYKKKVRAYVLWLESQDIEITAADIDVLVNYANQLRNRGNTHRTIRNVFACINKLYGILKWDKVITSDNPVPLVMKEYLRSFKSGSGSKRQLISIEQASKLVNLIMNSQDKALITLLFKTGCRATEALSIEIDDINWVDSSIQLKPFAKRTNRIVYFDEETINLLERWLLRSRPNYNTTSKSLFVGKDGGPMKIDALERMFKKYAIECGLDNPKSDRIEDHLSPHCCRHWFTTHLWRAGMSTEFIEELRCDVPRSAVSQYIHIDKEVLRESYLRKIPQLWIGL